MNSFWAQGEIIKSLHSCSPEAHGFLRTNRMSCSFAHRMKAIHSHLPLATLAAAAGLPLPDGPSSISENPTLEEDEDMWMEKRRLSFARIREKRRDRRGPMWVDGDSVMASEASVRYDLVSVVQLARD